MDEEVVLLEEQLAVAHADIERLETRLAESEARASSSGADAVELRRRLASTEDGLAARDTQLQSHVAELSGLQQRLADAIERSRTDAGRYRDLVLAREPELPADLVTGDSVDAIEEALGRARQTVAQVRSHLEHQAQALRVPAGAPVRAAPDISGLSSAEKIRLGLQQA